jgi:toxin ParE1/3/4
VAELIWTEPALSDLDTIAEARGAAAGALGSLPIPLHYIALDNPEAARDLVRRVFRHVEQLAEYPQSGSRPKELRTSRYRQIVEPPCRVFYRYDGERAFVLYARGDALAQQSARRERPTEPEGLTGSRTYENFVSVAHLRVEGIRLSLHWCHTDKFTLLPAELD